MSSLSKRMLLNAAACCLGLALFDSAHADASATAILDIHNFRLLHASGATYNLSDFSMLTGTNDAHATASLNGVFANGAQSLSILSGSTPSVAHQCVGIACPPKPENDFTPFASPAPVPGDFGYADQDMSGKAIDIGSSLAGVHARTRADASLTIDGVAAANSGVGTSTTFAFKLGASDTMAVAFDATPYTQAYVSADALATTNANARMSWSINIYDLNTGVTVLSYQPSQLNALANVSLTDGAPGIQTPYAYPTMFSLGATSLFLSSSDTYQVTIDQNTLANVVVSVPEPSQLLMLGLGLGLCTAMLAIRRRA